MPKILAIDDNRDNLVAVSALPMTVRIRARTPVGIAGRCPARCVATMSREHMPNCLNCDFFKLVQKQEATAYTM